MVPCSGGKIGPTWWASPVHPKLGSGWTIKLLAQKKSGQIWPGPIWPGPARLAHIIFAFKRLFGPGRPVFKAGRAAKMLARKIRANFGQTRFWPGPARPTPLDCQLSFHGLPNTTSIQNSNIHLHCHCGEPELVHCTNYKPFYGIFEITNLLHF